MAQEDKIIDLLNSLQKSNDINTDNLNRLSALIEATASNADNKEEYELVKSYINELANSVENKYTTTLNKFEDIEKALKAVYSTQNLAVKNSDMKDLFESFSKGINNLFSEARQGKAILGGVETKLTQMVNNKTDKEDIMRTISLLRKDSENINLSYKNTVDGINANLKSIISMLMNFDPLRSNEKVISQIEWIYKSIGDLTVQIKSLNDYDEKLERILNNVATNEDLKTTKTIIEAISQKTDDIEQKLGTLPEKSEISQLKDSASSIAGHTVNIPDIKKLSSDMLDETDNIKQELSHIAENMEKLPDAQELSTGLEKLYSLADTLLNSILTTDVRNDLSGVREQIAQLQKELDTIKNIVSDLNDAMISNINESFKTISTDTSYDLKKAVSEMLTLLPQKSDIEKLLSTSSENYQTLQAKADSIDEKLNKLPELEENQKNISSKISEINFDKEFSHIYDKTTSIESWLIDSNIKENSAKIAQQMELASTADAVDQIQYRTNEIIDALEKLSQSYDVNKVGENIVNIDKKIEEIIGILQDEAQNRTNTEIIDKLSDLERSISEIVSRSEFNDFIDELKYCITKLSTNTGSCTANIEEMQRLQKKIDETLQNLDFSNTVASLDGKFGELNQKIEEMSLATNIIPELQKDVADIKTANDEIINSKQDTENNLRQMSDYMQNTLMGENNIIKAKLDEIKSLVDNYSTDIQNADSEIAPDIELVEKYLQEIKTLITDKSYDELIAKIQDVEKIITDRQSYNDTALEQIVQKLDEVSQKLENDNEENRNLINSIKELDSLQEQISDIKDLLIESEPKDTQDSQDIYFEKVEQFLSDKLTEINNNITDITSKNSQDVTNNIAYQTNLLEEKTSAIQRLIEELSVADVDNAPEQEDKLALISDKLADFKSELQLISTDVTENLTSQNEKFVSELEPIKQTLEQIAANSNIDYLKKEIEALHNELISNQSLSEDSDQSEKLYNKIINKFSENENNLKDFIMTDNDSVILKMDELRDYLEKSLDAIVPPAPEKMTELNQFVNSIKEFKTSQEKLINDAVETVNNNITTQNDEIKALIATAINHDDILEAIEDLKKCFKSKLKKLTAKNTSDEPVQTSDVTAAPLLLDDEAIDDLKDDISRYGKQIEKLSSNNEQITNVLNTISAKLDEMSLNTQPQEQPQEPQDDKDEDDELEDFSQDDILEENQFDFVQAFDILQNDIKNLSASVEQLQKENNNNNEKQSSLQIPTVNGNFMMSLNSKIDEVLKNLNKDWAKDINEYINSNSKELNKKIDQISSKLDVMVSDTSNTEMLEEVSDKLSESDKKISSMLEQLSQKLVEISSKGTNEQELEDIKSLISEQKDYIKMLEPGENLDAFKKCLNELSQELNNLSSNTSSDTEQLNKAVKEMKESIMAAVVTIFDQVSFVEETEDIKDFVEERTNEINKNIEQINKQLHLLSSSGNDSDYTYSMQDIETDLSKLRLALNDLQAKDEQEKAIDLSEITDKLHNITSSVDSLTQEEMKDLKSEITSIKEQTQFLIANSDKSYDAINMGIEGFNGNLSDKVDKLSDMLQTSAQSDNVVRQALVYIGEWIDNVSESINKISSNSDGIHAVKDQLEALGKAVNNQITTAIEEKFELRNAQFLKLEKRLSKVESLEEQMANQQERIDRLEKNIDKLLSMVENFDDPVVNRKIDKIEKQITKLGTNVEKLASYVD